MERNGHNAGVYLTGVSPKRRSVNPDIGALNRGIVLQNDVVRGR